jgi:hypothetical protein
MLIALGAACDRAAATVVVAKDFAALCAEADLIFVGTVSKTESRWIDRDKQAIETQVTFEDLTWLRGPAQSSITLHFAGGEVDGLREEIAGVPGFTVGERRIIFARNGRYVSPIVGFDQGALRVVEGRTARSWSGRMERRSATAPPQPVSAAHCAVERRRRTTSSRNRRTRSPRR